MRIDLGDGRHSYAQVSTDPLVIFFDYASSVDLGLREICKLPVAFKVHVFHDDLKRGVWERIGNCQLNGDQLEHPLMFIQDSLSGRLFLYHPDFAESNFERPATLDECRGLKLASVWQTTQIEDRLRDHFEGLENKWVNSMAIQESKV